MGPVGTIVVVVCLVAGVGGAVVGFARRRLGDERHAMRDYQETLATLRRVAGGRPSPPAPGRGRAVLASTTAPPRVSTRVDAPRRPPRSRPTPAPSPSSPPGPAEPPTATSGDPAPATPSAAVRELATGRLVPRRAGRTRPGAGPGARRARRSRTRPPQAPAGASRAGIVVAVVLVAAAVAATVGALAPGSPSRTAATGPVVTQPARTTATTAAPRTAPASGAVVPAETAGVGGGYDPVTASATAAVYDLPAASVPVVLVTDGPCWVLATDAGGHTLWIGTMEAGQSQTLSMAGGLVLRLGAAMHVRATVGGQPVRFPIGFESPFDVTFKTA